MYDIELPNIRPGVLSAVLFIFLDVILVALLDNALTRIASLVYYRNVDQGQTVFIQSTDIPGISNFLIGRRFSVINIMSVLTKLILLGIVLAANISIKGKDTMTKIDYRDATFGFDPSDAFISSNKNPTVEQRVEHSKSCFKEDNEKLIYYSLRFDLNNVTSPDGNDVTSKVDDPTIICMSEDNVKVPEPLVTVTDCTRRNKTLGQSCLSIIASTPEAQKSFDSLSEPTKSLSEGIIYHEFWDYNKEEIQDLFQEYDNPNFTCLFTEVGAVESVPIDFLHCLLVAFKKSKQGEDLTIVERWVLSKKNDGQDIKNFFVMEYPGIIFEGRIDIGRLASERYLKVPLPFTNYITLSGELISQASFYKPLEPSKRRFGRLERRDGLAVTAVDLYAVPLVIGATFIVLVSFLTAFVVTCRDKRPRFNTINGLSSIIREEKSPSGRSYAIGESTILGLSFTGDTMHLGPLQSRSDARRFIDSQDWS